MKTLIGRICNRIQSKCGNGHSLRGFSSPSYWEQRYSAGGNSGAGSYGQLANFKAEVLNAVVKTHHIQSVIEFGCGDGNQLSLAEYPQYLGFDVSKAAIDRCIGRFAKDETKSFLWYDPKSFQNNGQVLKADLAISLDVIFHLIEDDIYAKYMQDLFAAASRMVVIYSSNMDRPAPAMHVRHRIFTEYVAIHFPKWKLVEHIPNRFPEALGPDQGSFADFFAFQIAENASTGGLAEDQK